MGIVKRVKELFSGKPASKAPAKIDPNLKKLRETAKKHGDRLKLKPALKSAKTTKRGK